MGRPEQRGRQQVTITCPDCGHTWERHHDTVATAARKSRRPRCPQCWYCNPLTARQREVWCLIRGFIEVHGHSPTYRELAERMGCTTSGALSVVRTIVAHGALELVPYARRGIRLVEGRP